MCAKLKAIQLLSTSEGIAATKSAQMATDSALNTRIISENANTVAVSLREMAMKYYAAFPALDSGGHLAVDDSDTKPVVTAKRVKSGGKAAENKWNGQRIIESMVNNGKNGNNKYLLNNNNAFIVEDSSALNSAYDMISFESGENLDHVNDNKENYESAKTKRTKTFDSISKISEEFLNNKLAFSSLITSAKDNNDINGTKAVYCGDIEHNLLTMNNNNSAMIGTNGVNGVNSIALVVSNNNNNYYNCNATDETLSIDENECDEPECNVFQRLVEKFNSNIASIWSSGDSTHSSSSLSKSRNNIWSFDSFSSNQSSASPSPKYHGLDVWSAAGEVSTTEASVSTPLLVNQMISSLTPIPEFWESNVIERSISNLDSEQHINNWIAKNYDTFVKRIKSECSKTITLQNHEENSLFVEFGSLSATLKKSPKDVCDGSNQLSIAIQSNQKIGGANFSFDISPEENLLTSPKTHFQPIKQDLFDRDSSEEESMIDDEVAATLVICSEKCPNNGSSNSERLVDSNLAKPRPVSTSLKELSTFMGPFSADNDQLASIADDAESFDEDDDKLISIANDKRDQSTNTDNNNIVFSSSSTLESIIETDGNGIECEPEYQDLCNMINEVLRNGLTDEDNGGSNGLNFNVRNILFDDWYDDNVDNFNDISVKSEKEKRLSWNYYWDTYDVNTGSANTSGHHRGGSSQRKELLMDSDNRLLSEEIINDHVFEELRDGCEKFMLNGDRDAFISEGNSFAIDSLVDDIFFDELNGYCRRMKADSESDFTGFSMDSESQYFFNETDESENFTTVANNNNNNDSMEDHIWSTNGGEFSKLVVESTFLFEMKRKNVDVAKKKNRKPCTFYMEGNCKRSDCKYSHDLSKITCKYWKEGFCFKAHLCPFLHGYASH